MTKNSNCYGEQEQKQFSLYCSQKYLVVIYLYLFLVISKDDGDAMYVCVRDGARSQSQWT